MSREPALRLLSVQAVSYTNRNGRDATRFDWMRVDDDGRLVSRCGHVHHTREGAERCMAREVRRWEAWDRG